MVWTAEQTVAFLAHARDHRLYPMCDLIAHRGLRRGEAVGLPWGDLDLESATVTIREQLIQLGWEVERGRPKSDAGERVIALDSGTVRVLRAHRERQREERAAWGDAWVDSDLVFVREDGSPLHPAMVTRTFRSLCEEAGLPADPAPRPPARRSNAGARGEG